MHSGVHTFGATLRRQVNGKQKDKGITRLATDSYGMNGFDRTKSIVKSASLIILTCCNQTRDLFIMSLSTTVSCRTKRPTRSTFPVAVCY